MMKKMLNALFFLILLALVLVPLSNLDKFDSYQAKKDTVPATVAEPSAKASLDAAEQYAKEELGITMVCYKNYDLELANQVNDRIGRLYAAYPTLKGRMNYAGDYLDVRDKIDSFVEARYSDRSAADIEDIKTYYRERILLPPLSLAVTIQAGEDEKLKGIVFNDAYVGNITEIEQYFQNPPSVGFYPKDCTGLRYIIDHELGHFMNNELYLQSKPKLVAYYKELTSTAIREGLSGYATESFEEFLAECWAEYQNSASPRKMATEVSEIIIGYLG